QGGRLKSNSRRVNRPIARQVFRSGGARFILFSCPNEFVRYANRHVGRAMRGGSRRLATPRPAVGPSLLRRVRRLNRTPNLLKASSPDGRWGGGANRRKVNTPPGLSKKRLPAAPR